MNKKILLIIEFSLVIFLILLSGVFSETEAQEFQTLTSCNNISARLTLRSQCYASVAAQTNDVNLCFKEIPPIGNMQPECVIGVAFHNKDVLVCNQIINTTNTYGNSIAGQIDRCTSMVGIATNNSALCNSINNGPVREECYSGIRINSYKQAVQAKNSSFCTSIGNSGFNKRSCYKDMGFDFKNYLSNFDYFLYWTKISSYWIAALLLIAFLFYSFYRQIKNRIYSQSHLSKLTVVGLIATILLGVSVYIDLSAPGGMHSGPITGFTGIPLLLFIVLGALMIFRKQKLINN